LSYVGAYCSDSPIGEFDPIRRVMSMGSDGIKR